MDEMPAIRQVRESINSEEVELLIVNLSKYDNIQAAKDVIEKENIKEIAYFDMNGNLGDEYNIIGIPAAFYIDKDGVINDIKFGREEAEDILLKLERIIE